MLLSIFDTQPIDFWHDTLVQLIVIAVVTLLAAIIGSVISFWFTRKQQPRKIISFAIISQAPIASINEDVEDKVEILFDGKPVDDMALLVIKLWNSGNVAVKPEDYVEPIKLKFLPKFDEDPTVVGCDILNTEPKDLIGPKDTKISFDTGEVTLPKILLNPKESITLKVLLIGIALLNVGARIVDGEVQVEYIDMLPLTIKLSRATFLALGSDFFFCVFIMILEFISAPHFFDASFVVLCIIIFFVLLPFIYVAIILSFWFYDIPKAIKNGTKLIW